MLNFTGILKNCVLVCATLISFLKGKRNQPSGLNKEKVQAGVSLSVRLPRENSEVRADRKVQMGRCVWQ